MGMYDSIDCQYPLPMPDDPKGYTGSFGFQTKDFDCALDIYIIDKDGQLFLEQREMEWVEGNPNGKGFLEKSGYAKTVKTWLEPLNNTCTVEFYDYSHSNNTDYDYWIVYNAIFINGKLSEVKLTTFEATANSERKKKDIEFHNKLRKWGEFTKTRRYKYLLKPYNKCLKFVCDKAYNFFYSAASRVRRVHNFLSIK
jgi:hypothetical protein